MVDEDRAQPQAAEVVDGGRSPAAVRALAAGADRPPAARLAAALDAGWRRVAPRRRELEVEEQRPLPAVAADRLRPPAVSRWLVK